MNIIKLTINQILILLVFYCFLALSTSYIAEFVFDMKPCILCLYQRIPFFAIIAIGISSLFFKKELSRKLALFLCIILLAVNIGIALYHVGVEKKIFHMTQKCMSEAENFATIAELQKHLENQAIARCDEPQFIFLGLSMAAWNALFCLFLLISSLALYKKSDLHFP
ncbi:MAG TPA: disulfide bond formation protein B [Rickettsiales bacterium]|nr:disulfide bond formation protein B [Rickettsiales bacterium]